MTREEVSGTDIAVRTAGGVCPIVAESGALGKLGAIAAAAVRGRSACVVTDSNVAPLHLEAAVKPLRDAGFAVATHVIPAGERSKTPEGLVSLWDAFSRAGLTRSDLVVALGGGVVGDLAGFAAATWLRGVAVIQVPTSLLAFVDSSIGGKTAIDLPAGKNLAGAFHQPVAVVADPRFLRTLPAPEIAQGMAEVVKYGCILDADFFSFLEGVSTRGPGESDFARIIRRCAEMKADIVSRDEREGSLRKLLNFGHTVGHAIEKTLGYGVVSHGEAVAAGSVAAVRIGEALGVTPKGSANRIAALLRAFSLPDGAAAIGPEAADPDSIAAAMLSDKKKFGADIHFILLRRIGEATIFPMTAAKIREFLPAALAAAD